MATLRHKIGNLISVPLTMVRLMLMKTVYPHNLKFSGIERFSPDVVVDVDRKSELCFGRRVCMRARCRVTSADGGVLKIGDRTSFNVGCMAVCRKKITIGKNVMFGPNVMIYDHDHNIDSKVGFRDSGYLLGEVDIGDSSWIGAGSIILRGTHIGRNCVIAAGSVVKGNVPDNTVLIQKRVNMYKEIESDE